MTQAWAIINQRKRLANNTINYVLGGMGHPQEFPVYFCVNLLTISGGPRTTAACFDHSIKPPMIKLCLGDEALATLFGNTAVAPDIAVSDGRLAEKE